MQALGLTAWAGFRVWVVVAYLFVLLLKQGHNIALSVLVIAK